MVSTGRNDLPIPPEAESLARRNAGCPNVTVAARGERTTKEAEYQKMLLPAFLRLARGVCRAVPCRIRADGAGHRSYQPMNRELCLGNSFLMSSANA